METNCCGVWISFRAPNIRQAADVVRIRRNMNFLVIYPIPLTNRSTFELIVEEFSCISLKTINNVRHCAMISYCEAVWMVWIHLTGLCWTRLPGLPLWCSESPGCIYPALGITLPGTLSNKLPGPTLIWEIALQLLLRLGEIKSFFFYEIWVDDAEFGNSTL